MQTQRPSSMSTFAMLVSLGMSSLLLLAESQRTASLAQNSTNPTSVSIDNLTQMAPINQALKQQYETQFPNSTIEIQAQPPNTPLQLQPDDAQLAAISRLLTDDEKAQGFVQVPVTREKIAIVIGQNNPYAAGLTIDQVVKIFKGEITDWSQLGGQPGPIRVIHRPIASNLQSTLQTYALFQQADFEAGGKIVQLDQDSLSALSNALGRDGISYALASQINNANTIRPVSMYNTLPDDPQYPFSQPFTYIYKDTPTAAAKTFLEYVASEQGQAAIAQAKERPTLFRDLDLDSPSQAESSTSPSTDDQNKAEKTNPQSETPENSAGPTTSNEPRGSEASPVASSSSGTAARSSEDANGFGWLPIGLMILVIGGVIGGIFKTLLAKKKPKTAPRPAPNYAEKIRPTRIQGSNTEIQSPPEGASIDSDQGEALSNASGRASVDPTAGAAAMGMAESASSIHKPQSSEPQPQSPAWLDITSKELQAQTRIQNSNTELQDTPPSISGPKTQLQDSTATQLQSFDDHDMAPANLEESQDDPASAMEGLGANPNLNPSTTVLQDPSPTHLQEDPSQTQLQDPSVTVLQEPSPTQLQDPNPTQLQDPSSTVLQEPSQTQLQDPSITFLQEPSPTQLQDPSSTVLQEPSPTQLQDPSATQLQDPKQTWAQSDDFPHSVESSETQDPDPNATQLQDPNQTHLQDPKQTWIQSQDFPQGQDPSVTQLPDPKQTWIQDDDH
ncbi:substrate-binding domain-containing protein [Acaryochloris sp. IP29b_bin.137]|uniref:substrate-binding domain-containing protein n=1 Tax=Acaryochloris sp. IP29b_bin.137 TaxID=2969217 RepID=UPI002623418D|nr:substrate-binding domain-containing protein [Acaryochloris sp. IP29b_bin.137]